MPAISAPWPAALYYLPLTVKEFDAFVRDTLITPVAAADIADTAPNGLQVGADDDPLTHVAFAVDAGLEVLLRAADCGAELLFVHHGLFWGRQVTITAGLYSRVRVLIERSLSLYAVHLPLDAHPELGNNAGMAAALELTDCRPFGSYNGVKIGVAGRVPEARYPEGATLDELLGATFGGREKCTAVLPFGAERIRTVGLVSGGGTRLVSQAIAEEIDLYITGDASHEAYHESLEAGINVVFAGHYATEIWGVRTMMAHTEAHTDLTTSFIDLPTGL